MELRFEQLVPAGVEDVFRFHENPANLARLLHRWPRFRLIRHDGLVQVGGVMWVEERFWGIPVAMAFRYHVCERPHRLGGKLIHGPFDQFEHLHEFAPAGGGTLVRDTLQLAVPRCFGGRFTLRRMIAPLICRAFVCRQRALLQIAESDGLASSPPRAPDEPHIRAAAACIGG